MLLRWLPGILLLAVGSLIMWFFLQNRTNGRIVTGGKVRRYLLYVPDSYDPEHPAPLVVSLHGFVQWPAHQCGMTGWNTLADQHGFLVVYPQGTRFPLRWQTQPTPGGTEKMEQDVRFIADLLDHLCRKYAIDESRIYVNGMSNGGGMAHLLALMLPERIAAIGGVAGAYLYQPAFDKPARPMPVIAFHGTQDPIVPYAGGRSRTRRHPFEFPSIEAWAAGWAERDGCAGQPEETRLAEDVRTLRYSACREGAEVVLYIIEGGGHTWPGGEPLQVWLTGRTCTSVDASALMWDFFRSHPLAGS
ncbi:MAG: alpha/beta hydrolase fold domain-containing protein [Anaerolineales bacterium]|nr:alpha/beta hydrolase fold domain-containing protein [Anaerolineales bacterium]